ncbi:MAG: HEAT repeat domain-containing protein [Planctomycetota bacterium]
MRTTRRIIAALAACACFGPAPAAQQAAQATASEEASLPTWTPEEEAAIRLLRTLRKKDRPADEVLVAQLSLPGEQLFPLFFEVLSRRQVPALEGGEAQILSEIQEEILLQTVAQLDRETVLAHVEAQLLAGADLRLRYAAMLSIGRAGRANDLPQLFELALPAAEPALDKRMALGLERAVTALARRDPRTFEQLVSLRRITRAELLPTLIDALGEAGDPRGLLYLGELLYWAEPLALDIMSQIPRVGASGDPALDEPLRVRLRPFLAPDRPGHCRAAITALATLADLESIPGLIALLTSEDRGLKENAHWALKELTGLGFSAAPDTWARWHQSELSWTVRSKALELQRLQNGDPAEAAEALCTLLTHPFARVDLRRTLPELLRSRHPALRGLACRTLGELGVVEATEKLVWTLEDEIPEVRSAAHAALRQLTRLDLPLEPVAWQSATHSDPRTAEL